MVTEGLNNIAVTLGKQVREKLEAEIVDYDVQVAQSQHEYEELVKQVRAKNEQTKKLWDLRKAKIDSLNYMDTDLRELSRPRDGFPYLDDVAYEMRMHELRITIQGVSDEMAKRDTWSE